MNALPPTTRKSRKTQAVGYWICTALIGLSFLSGGGAVLFPGFARLKEWAYAGMIFDLTGAAAAHAASDDDVRHILTPLALAVLVVASWALRPEGRKLKRAYDGLPSKVSI